MWINRIEFIYKLNSVSVEYVHISDKKVQWNMPQIYLNRMLALKIIFEKLSLIIRTMGILRKHSYCLLEKLFKKMTIGVFKAQRIGRASLKVICERKSFFTIFIIRLLNAVLSTPPFDHSLRKWKLLKSYKVNNTRAFQLVL